MAPASSRRSALVVVAFSARTMMGVLCVTNLINYVDRGIIPGATGAFEAFIDRAHDTVGSSTNTLFGALQSAFIVGFSAGSLVVGHLVHSRSPFKLASWGLAAWCVAAVVAGAARHLRSYVVLVLARMASGLGEAGFVTVGGPYIQDAGGAAWLGLFYAMIPTGTAIGYGYGAVVAETLGWSWCYWIESLCMAPLVVAFAVSKDDGAASFVEKHRDDQGVVGDDDQDYSGGLLEAEEEEEDPRGPNGAAAAAAATAGVPRRRHPLLSSEEKEASGDDEVENPLRRPEGRDPATTTRFETDTGSVAGGASPDGAGRPPQSSAAVTTPAAPTVLEEVATCFRRPAFPWVCLGYAGYAGSVLGFSTFAPSIAVGLGLFPKMDKASIAFSLTMATSGIVGTPLGGLALEYYERAFSRPRPVFGRNGRKNGHAVPEQHAEAESTAATTNGAALSTPRRRGHCCTKKKQPSSSSSSGSTNGEETSPEAVSSSSSSAHRLRRSLELSLAFVGVGGVVVAGAAAARTPGPYLAALFVGTLPLFAATTPMNVALFESVPRTNRAFGQALGVLVMHAAGDVPTPMLVGALKDALAPACTPDKHDRVDDPDCDAQRPKLRLIAVACAAWLLWSLLAFGIAYARAFEDEGDDDSATAGSVDEEAGASSSGAPGDVDRGETSTTTTNGAFGRRSRSKLRDTDRSSSSPMEAPLLSNDGGGTTASSESPSSQ